MCMYVYICVCVYVCVRVSLRARVCCLWLLQTLFSFDKNTKQTKKKTNPFTPDTSFQALILSNPCHSVLIAPGVGIADCSSPHSATVSCAPSHAIAAAHGEMRSWSHLSLALSLALSHVLLRDCCIASSLPSPVLPVFPWPQTQTCQ